VDRSEFTKLKNYVFGSTAAIITNTSLIVGMGSAGTGKGPILGGLLTIALADNISDSLGIHMYKETEGGDQKLSALATALNFAARLLVSLSFVAIILVLSPAWAMPVAILWGLLLLVIISYLINRSNGRNSVLEILKHLLVAVAVIAVSHYAGLLIGQHFH
jgi:VIT1/CCC1 family predicted Fe2+/Mn2+ transporter